MKNFLFLLVVSLLLLPQSVWAAFQISDLNACVVKFNKNITIYSQQTAPVVGIVRVQIGQTEVGEEFRVRQTEVATYRFGYRHGNAMEVDSRNQTGKRGWVYLGTDPVDGKFSSDCTP
jgi:hypothetical protein